MNTETYRLLNSNEPECPYATHVKDAQTGKYLDCNSAFSEYIGIPLKEVPGLTVETCFNQRQWEENAKTDLFHWWRATEPENIRRFDEEVQKTRQRVKKQRLSITSTGLIRFKETVKSPIFSLDFERVVALLTQSRDITLHCNLFRLLNTYQHYYTDQDAVQHMLITLDIDGYFAQRPALEEVKVLLVLRDGFSDRAQNRHIQSLQALMSAGDWREMLTRLRMIPIEPH
jgi:hypothetical protein